MNPTNLNLIYQYALLLAADEDWDQRELGPIHLLKFAYLADVAYAEHNQGETYTKVDWTFHNFGPWSVEANSAIDPAVLAIGAEKRNLPSQYEGDFIRYSIQGDADDLNRRERELREQLPFEIRGALQRAVHNFASDTKKLLHAVYATAPMLIAAPGEHLDFHQAVREPQAVYATAPAEASATRLSKKKQTQFKSRMAELRKNCRRNFEAAQADRHRLRTRENPEELADVTDWLDHLAGPDFPTEGATVHFSDDVWKSASRRGEDFDDISG